MRILLLKQSRNSCYQGQTIYIYYSIQVHIQDNVCIINIIKRKKKLLKATIIVAYLDVRSIYHFNPSTPILAFNVPISTNNLQIITEQIVTPTSLYNRNISLSRGNSFSRDKGQ